MSSKKVLVIGATGVMGRHLIPHLADRGYEIDAVSLDDVAENRPNVNRIKLNAKENKLVYRKLVSGKRYDGIVDFMMYPTNEIIDYLPYALDNTDHYLFFSSYRVYDDKETPLTETSPRLYDDPEKVLLHNSDDYAIFKARGENVIRSFTRNNWTILRPVILYSLMRYPLVTLEAPDTVGRAFAGKAVILPEQARNVRAALAWGGDIARMIAGLLFNENARGETYLAGSAEPRTWGEIADDYREICGLKTVWVDKEEYIRILMPDSRFSWQLDYDRLFDRVIDNSKILAATGMKQSELIPLRAGLEQEIARCPRDRQWPVNAAMDAYLQRVTS